MRVVSYTLHMSYEVTVTVHTVTEQLNQRSLLTSVSYQRTTAKCSSKYFFLFWCCCNLVLQILNHYQPPRFSYSFSIGKKWQLGDQHSIKSICVSGIFFPLQDWRYDKEEHIHPRWGPFFLSLTSFSPLVSHDCATKLAKLDVKIPLL